MSHRVAEFSVSDGVKARFLFLADKFGNSLILHLDEFFTAELFCCKIYPCLFQALGTQKAADSIKSIRWLLEFHEVVPFRCGFVRLQSVIRT